MENCIKFTNKELDMIEFSCKCLLDYINKSDEKPLLMQEYMYLQNSVDTLNEVLNKIKIRSK